MSLKGLIFIGIFGICTLGALVAPHLGIYGYLADYCINPSDQWWSEPFTRVGIRYSLTLALFTLVGIIFQRSKLKFGDKLFYQQEWSLLLFLGVIWLLTLLTPDTVGRYTIADHPSIKLTKIFVFVLMMTHVVTDVKKLSGLFWTLASVSLVLGLKAWDTPYGRFVGGRLEGIGGADFGEANFFAAFMAAMLPVIGIQFLRSKSWSGKLYALICGIFTADAVVLCRSRGAFVGIAMGVIAALWFSPKNIRPKVVALLLVGMLGVFYLTDNFFIERIMTITADEQNMDESAANRIELWKAGAKIFAKHPLGIGPGNWYQNIGMYIPEYEGKDSHNTFVKCAVELGILGISVFLLMLCQAYINLNKVRKMSHSLSEQEAIDFDQYCFAILVSLVVLLTCALTITMIYIEIVWVLLMLPVCLRRALDNVLLEDQQKERQLF